MSTGRFATSRKLLPFFKTTVLANFGIVAKWLGCKELSTPSRNGVQSIPTRKVIVSVSFVVPKRLCESHSEEIDLYPPTTIKNTGGQDLQYICTWPWKNCIVSCPCRVVIEGFNYY
eukprot:1354145-Rhodomonas_salina.1